MAGSNRKKKRNPKTSKGIHGATRHPLTEIEKVLAGKGAFESFKPVECKTPWKGARDVGPEPYDKAQVDLNKELYPHLFVD